MATTDAQATWLRKVLRVDVAARGNDPGGTGVSASKMQRALAACLRKLDDYAEDDAQRQDWSDRLEQALELVDNGEDDDAKVLVDALQTDMADATARVRAGTAWFDDWSKAYESCLESAETLKSAMIADIKAVDPGVLGSFETGWSILEEELAGVGDVIEHAMVGSRTQPAGARQAIVAEAATAALRLIDQSSLLCDIDENDVQPVAIVQTLRVELRRLQ